MRFAGLQYRKTDKCANRLLVGATFTWSVLDPHGIKIWALCESTTGYLVAAFVAAGTVPGMLNPTANVVVKLLQDADCCGQYHHLWTDNLFSRAY